MAENLANDVQTLLSGAINNSVTAITTAGATGMPAANFRVRVDDEIMLVTSTGSGANWTVTRGAEGTTAAAHVDQAIIVHVLSKGGLDQYLTERPMAARAWVNFTSVTTTTIRSSFNVTSLTNNGVGDTTINLTTSLGNTNYAVLTGCGDATDTANKISISGGVVTATTIRVITTNPANNALIDKSMVCVAALST